MAKNPYNQFKSNEKMKYYLFEIEQTYDES